MAIHPTSEIVLDLERRFGDGLRESCVADFHFVPCKMRHHSSYAVAYCMLMIDQCLPFGLRRKLCKCLSPMEDKRELQSHGNYGKFFAMIATSIVVMFFLMYLHSYQLLDHAWFSETRLFMALIMGAGMMVVMLSYMLGMYQNKSANLAIFAGAIALFAVSLWLVRSQVTVDDSDYMEGMIPHHSIAILTSERADIRDPRVRILADDIIKAQRKEINEMEWLIADIEANGIAENDSEANARAIPSFEGVPE